jgi:hypothetical protein
VAAIAETAGWTAVREAPQPAKSTAAMAIVRIGGCVPAFRILKNPRWLGIICQLVCGLRLPEACRGFWTTYRFVRSYLLRRRRLGIEFRSSRPFLPI